MLTDSIIKVEIKTIKKDKPVLKTSFKKLKDIKDLFDKMVKEGAHGNIKFLTYNILKRTFGYVVPSYINNMPLSSKYLTLTLVLSKDAEGKEELYKVDIPDNCKILLQNHNLSTSINTLALEGIQKTARVAYVTFEDDKYDVKFCPIKSITYPARDYKQDKNVKVKDYSILKMDTKDGSMFVCDHVILK